MLCSSSTPNIDGKVALDKIRSSTYDNINLVVHNYKFQFNPKTSEWVSNINTFNEEVKEREEEINKEISVLIKEEEKADEEYDRALKEYQYKLTQMLILTKVVSNIIICSIYKLYLNISNIINQ